jgi:transketolase
MCRTVRRTIVEQSKSANVGHIGSALSVVEILAALYGAVLKIETPTSLDRDRFILSKGHAALALYCFLQLRGWLKEPGLSSYCGDGTLLGVHPEHVLPGVDFSSGSLGHGLSVGAGAALAARRQRSRRSVFVLMSDAECNEGAVWEAAMFAAHHRLANLIGIIDLNGQQALGYTRDVLSLSPMAERWRAFGWAVQEVDGHNVEEIAQILQRLDTANGPPHLLIARTVFGKGVSYMENQIKWHYWPMSDTEFDQAILELSAAECGRRLSRR